MKTTPKTEKEIYEANLLPKGWYPFTINEAAEKVSKAGNEMIEVNVRVYKDAGFIFVKDFLMDTEFGAMKLRHISETCGLLAEYEAGAVTADDLTGKEGFCKIGIQKDKTGQFADRNAIQDYSKEDPSKKTKSTAGAGGKPANDDPSEDDIPF